MYSFMSSTLTETGGGFIPDFFPKECQLSPISTQPASQLQNNSKSLGKVTSKQSNGAKFMQTKDGGSDGDQGKATTKINKMMHLPSERAKAESDGAKGTVKAKERRENGAKGVKAKERGSVGDQGKATTKNYK